MAKKAKLEVTRIEKRQRSFFGKIISVLFWGFNLVMLIWLIVYFGFIGEQYDTAGSSAEQAGTVIGATIGIGMLLWIWVIGAVILGIFMLLTRGRKLIMSVSDGEKS